MSRHELSAHAHHEEEDAFNRGGERRTLLVVILAFMMMIGEVSVGYMTGSVALISDGWHMGTHVGALGLTLVAYWYARTRRGNDAFSFGTGKVYALAGFTSGVVLVLVALWLAKESIERLLRPEIVDYAQALPVAVLGLIVNGVSALMLGTGHHYGHSHAHGPGHAHGHGHAHEAHDHALDRGAPKAGTLDFNLRAAYVHIIADALTSLLAIGALSLGWWAGVWFLDPLTGLVGGVVISWWAIQLCRQASGQLLDVTSSPSHEDIVRSRLEAIDDVKVADLHVWELGPGRRSCIVSLVTSSPRDVAFYRDTVLAALPVAHLTIEIHQCGLPHQEPAHEHAHGHDH
ncbi:MAG: CDF family Co(II)/Ni(II) efflux transporter DmeF [Kofleriaceae bacterium]